MADSLDSVVPNLLHVGLMKEVRSHTFIFLVSYLQTGLDKHCILTKLLTYVIVNCDCILAVVFDIWVDNPELGKIRH